MMTYRERREAKADRLRGWAEKREAKAAQSFERVEQIAGMIPMGQPILRGHHSQGRAEKDQTRIHNGIHAGVEHARKAEQMQSRAANIEAAADHAIYSDDPDAIERLRERITQLELEREQIKTANAAYRKAHKDGLKGLTPYQRDQVMPHRSYELTNLGGNITRNRKRLAQLEARS
jgi:hypothetical protein